jgi:transcriptional regulator with GAF, ATPase, and Fis domain
LGLNNRKKNDTMSSIKKANQSLPIGIKAMFTSLTDSADRDNLIRSLNLVGWTQSSIARAIDLTRERVRQICVTPMEETGRTDFTLPMPPQHEVKEKREFIEPDPEALARLLELQPMAQQVRSNAMRFRAEAEEYTALVAKLHNQDGVTLYRLALRLGVTHSALRFRLARYGYKISEKGASKVYAPINPKNRIR